MDDNLLYPKNCNASLIPSPALTLLRTEYQVQAQAIKRMIDGDAVNPLHSTLARDLASQVTKLGEIHGQIVALERI
jgi:hypothetical protein